ncbi:hypothetical protein GGD55_004286 [Rhizobium giardinii]|uniref:Uncharacterized protein n=1 Tax=Rhizobium giardinii TaxID=56731 RepID=A0A7W8UDU1_9HYPH|nr:hypothetical protein [Rhizobium giardinii]
MPNLQLLPKPFWQEGRNGWLLDVIERRISPMVTVRQSMM